MLFYDISIKLNYNLVNKVNINNNTNRTIFTLMYWARSLSVNLANRGKYVFIQKQQLCTPNIHISRDLEPDKLIGYYIK